jgi:hypothetical protein
VEKLKFKLDDKVILNGNKGIVWDYSSRYKDYDIKLEDGRVIHGIQETELEERK